VAGTTAGLCNKSFAAPPPQPQPPPHKPKQSGDAAPGGGLCCALTWGSAGRVHGGSFGGSRVVAGGGEIRRQPPLRSINRRNDDEWHLGHQHGTRRERRESARICCGAGTHTCAAFCSSALSPAGSLGAVAPCKLRAPSFLPPRRNLIEPPRERCTKCRLDFVGSLGPFLLGWKDFIAPLDVDGGWPPVCLVRIKKQRIKIEIQFCSSYP
jgi:hypothetical protein